MRGLLFPAVLLTVAYSTQWASATSVMAFIVNKTPVTLVLDSYSSDFGTFITYPPLQIGPYSMANFTMYGSGFVGYDVYYGSPSFVGCFDLSYLWDLAISKCDSAAVYCPASKPKSPSSGIVTQTTNGGDCYYQVNDDCPIFGDPLHTIYFLCTA